MLCMYLQTPLHGQDVTRGQFFKQSLSKVSKVGDLSRGWPEGPIFDSYYTKV